MLNSMEVKPILFFPFRGELSRQKQKSNGTMLVTRDHPLKECRHFFAFLLFYYNRYVEQIENWKFAIELLLRGCQMEGIA